MDRKRKTISKKDRFEIFKRDSFSCQYCGRSAPDVILRVDHIVPISKDGEDNIINMITACEECNQGKSNRELNDDTVIKKQKAQLDQLQERREQLEMMVDWHKGLLNLNSEEVDKASEFWDDLTYPWETTEAGKADVRRWIKKFGFNEVLECMRLSADHYLKRDDKDELLDESVYKAHNYVGRICSTRRQEAGKPYMKDLYYIRGILRNRLSYINDWRAIDLLEKAYLSEVSIDELRELAKNPQVKNWTIFQSTLLLMINDDLKGDL